MPFARRARAPGTCCFTIGVSGPVPNDFYALMEMTVGQDRLIKKALWVAWSRVLRPRGWLGGRTPTWPGGPLSCLSPTGWLAKRPPDGARACAHADPRTATAATDWAATGASPGQSGLSPARVVKGFNLSLT